MKKKRIFWLGMHKVLVETELKRLRMLGYEVFNPPYLSSVVDQSAVLDWIPPTDSTLPVEAITVLSKTKFFYSPIAPEAAEILNQFFEIAIVTIDPNWLKNFLQAYHGKVIYRVYGQPYRLSEYMLNTHILDLIAERENFWFCPHHEETLEVEDFWLKCLNTRVIPYCLSDNVMELKDQWVFRDPNLINDPEYNNMGLMCPRILDSNYYNYYYKLIKDYFLEDQFKIFGVQIIPVSDSQVVGTLKRKDFLKLFSKLRGFIYHYPESTTCYLPPIEFMTLGGPVIFLKDSLLSRYFKSSSPPPGEAANLSDLAKLAQQLKKGDYNLSNEIIESQKQVRKLYDPNYVWPIFDTVMNEILNTQYAPAPGLLYNKKTSKKRKTQKASENKDSILITFHKLGPNVEKTLELNYYSAEGIIRVTGLMVKALTQCASVIITSNRSDFGRVHGFFAAQINDPTKLKILILENEPENIYLKKINNRLKNFFERENLFNKIIVFLQNYSLKKLVLYFQPYFANILSSSYIKVINKDQAISHIIIPHYCFFPEAYNAKKPILLYLPDYLPHFYKGSLEMGDHWTWRYIGKKLAKKAKIVLTNSMFTKNYLPHTALKVRKEKIVCFPLAYLSQMHKTCNNSFINELIKKLPPLFIFYPTRDRTSKRLNDFSRCLNIVNNRLKTNGERRRVYGVLTTKFTSKENDNKYLISLSTLPDSALTAVYQRASALVFTSENEGNFPTQINEALFLNTPVIATDIPQIINELGPISNFLQLIKVGDCEKFADAILYTIDNRKEVLNVQQKAREYSMKHFSYDQFSNNFLEIFYKILPH